MAHDAAAGELGIEHALADGQVFGFAVVMDAHDDGKFTICGSVAGVEDRVTLAIFARFIADNLHEFMGLSGIL